jgi:hypothetical protein
MTVRQHHRSSQPCHQRARRRHSSHASQVAEFSLMRSTACSSCASEITPTDRRSDTLPMRCATTISEIEVVGGGAPEPHATGDHLTCVCRRGSDTQAALTVSEPIPPFPQARRTHDTNRHHQRSTAPQSHDQPSHQESASRESQPDTVTHQDHQHHTSRRSQHEHQAK